jgi:hypothetical protein
VVDNDWFPYADGVSIEKPVIREAAAGVEVLRTPWGLWRWVEELRVLDYYPNRKRHAKYTLRLNRKLNTLEQSMRKAMRFELDRI